jgi:small-conductance mechanosensitive channel
VPNSKFLTAHVKNLNFFKNYIYHDIAITVQQDDVDPVYLLEELEKIAGENFTSFEKDALAFNKKVEKRSAVDFADPNPQFFIKTTDLGHYTFTVKLFLPTLQATQVEKNIKKQFLAVIQAHKEEKQKAREREGNRNPNG